VKAKREQAFLPFGESDPNRSRTLRRDLVKDKRRKQADCSVRDSLGDFSVGVVFRHVGIWKCVDSTYRPIELAFRVETNEILPRKTNGLDIAGPYNPVFANVLHKPLKRRCRGLFQYVITCKIAITLIDQRSKRQIALQQCHP
jgi:hypothetical protein